MLRVSTTLLLIFSLRLTVFAGTYQYHPSSVLHLGGGFDPIRPSRPTLPCLEFSEVTHSENDAAVKTEFSSSVVHNREELYHQLNIDVNLSADFAFASGSASFKFDDEYQFGKEDLVWILKVSSDFGRYYLSNPHLNSQAKLLASAVEKQAFIDRCGYEYVTQERRIAQLTAVYSFHHLTESEKRHIVAAVSGSGAGLGGKC